VKFRLRLHVCAWVLLGCASAVAAQDKQELFNFVRPLDVVQVVTQDAELPDLKGEESPGGEVFRRVVFQSAKQPTLRLTPQSGSWDWSGQEALSVRIQNAMDWDLTLDVEIESGAGQLLKSRLNLRAGPAQTLLIPLYETSPQRHGMRAGVPMPVQYDGRRVLLAESVNGELDKALVRSVSLSVPNPDSAQSVLISHVAVQPKSPEVAIYQGIVDAYGQYTNGRWPGKIQRDEQLQQAAAEEALQLQKTLVRGDELDAYGGWKTNTPLTKTGFFHTEKRNGRWFLVTPDGNPFFSLGVNAVNSGQSATYIEGRVSMFSALPKEGEALAAFYGSADHQDGNGSNRDRAFAKGRWFDFYAANLQRTYGQFDPLAWRQRSQDRLLAWGFNTIGNWSAPEFAVNPRVPFTLPLSIRGDFSTISTGVDWWGAMPDPFDPRFAMAAERAVAIAARDVRDNPWLIGFFADNELAWAGPAEDPNGRYALAYSTLRLTTDVPAKRAFLKQLRDKYRNQDGLSKAWGIQLQAWELMEDPGFEAPLPSPEYPAIEADMQAFLSLYAQTYFKTISESLKWHAPNHLLLGGRFASSIPEAVSACAAICDVLSFNFYTREPQQGYDFEVLRKLDKPLMVTEFHFGSRDRGPFWGGVSEVYKEAERGPAYAQFLSKALEEPQIVGVHWFQYLDQPVTGRLLDGENGHLGLVAITDRPWDEFVKSVQRSNRQAVQTLKQQLEGTAAAKP
jgi:hypothetical protein